MNLDRRRSEREARRAAPPGFTSLATMTTNLQNLTHITLAFLDLAIQRNTGIHCSV